MVRQQFYTEPWKKHLEIYQDFSGGLNTTHSNDNLDVKETTNLINIEMAERGSLKRRHGMVKHILAPTTGKGQGYFRYYHPDQTYDEILAVNGKLYKDGVELPITDLVSFQTDRMIEAAQMNDKLYIATGTKLVVYDGTSASVVTPHRPEPLEALYIGTNGLADDPNNYLQDGTATFLRIDGVTTSLRYGVVNQATTFTVYVSKPDGSTIEYQFKYRKKGTETWTTGQDWSTSKTYNFVPTEVTEYEFDIYARVQGSTDDPDQYILPSYKVNQTNQNEDIDTSTIHTCNRILLHWNRLLLYGDTSNQTRVYSSHLNNGTYFPVPNSLDFENERREPLTTLVQFRDLIVAFTANSIQALYGKSPADYYRMMVNTSLGCIAPYSASNMGNYVTFLSKEGVQILKSLGYTENRMNVEKIDTKIDKLVTRTEDACSVVYDGQYHLAFPQENKRLRYYYDMGVWTKDESPKLHFSRLFEWGGNIYGQDADEGHIYKFDKEVLDDDGHVYEDVIETKMFDFGQPYHMKKLKEVQLLIGHQNEDVSVGVYVQADSGLVLSPETDAHADVDEDGNVYWVPGTTTNVKAEAGTVFGSWELGVDSFGNAGSSVKKLRISGKCRRTRVIIRHREAKFNHFLGLAYIFKVKRP